jgi:hypothetical protein
LSNKTKPSLFSVALFEVRRVLRRKVGEERREGDVRSSWIPTL